MRGPMRYSSCVDGRAEEISPGCPFTESWCGAVLGFSATPRLRPHFFNPRARCVSTAEEPPPDNRRNVSDGRCRTADLRMSLAQQNPTELNRSPVVNRPRPLDIQAAAVQWSLPRRHKRLDPLCPHGHRPTGRTADDAYFLLRWRNGGLRASASGLHSSTLDRREREAAQAEAPAHHIEGATRNARCLVGPRSSSRTNVRTGFGHRYLPSTQTWSRGNNGKKRISRTDQIQALLTRNLVRHIDLRARKFLAGMAARLEIRKSGGAKCDELRGPLGLRKRFMSWKFARKNPRDGNASSYLQENGG